MTSHAVLGQAIQALRAEERETARTLLQQLTQSEPLMADGWLWLAAASDDPDQKRGYLQQALGLNPTDRRIIAGLRVLGVEDVSPIQATSLTTHTGQSASGSAARAESATVEPALSPTTTSTSTRTPLAQPHFNPTGVRARRFVSWQLAALITVILLLVPLTILLI